MKKEYLKYLIPLVLAIVLILGMVIWNITVHLQSNRREEQIDSEIATELVETEPVVAETTEPIVEEVQTIDIQPIQDHLQAVGFLITQEYYFKDVIDYSEVKKLGDIFTIPWTEYSYLASYEGVVNAGIDFNGIVIEKDDELMMITVRIPAAEIKNVDIDPDSLQVYEEKKGWFSDPSVINFNSSLSELEDKAESDAKERGVLDKAQENAQLIIGNMVAEMVADTDYTYTIVTQSDQ